MNEKAKREAIVRILAGAKRLARRYYKLTGKPLGITGEIAEYETQRILRIKLTPARNAGYDATERIAGSTRLQRLQIKSRCLGRNAKPGQRLGSIDIDKKFDAVLMVLLDEKFDATAIYEAKRSAVIKAINKPGSKARNERHALGVNAFKSISTLRWPKTKRRSSN